MKHQEKKIYNCFQLNQQKISDPCNAEVHFQSFIRKKSTKSVKQWKIITQQSKTLENSNIVDIKLVIIEHPKTLHKLSKTVRQAQKDSQVGCNSSLYSGKKNPENFLNENKIKITNEHMLLRIMQVLLMLKFWILLILNHTI